MFALRHSIDTVISAVPRPGYLEYGRQLRTLTSFLRDVKATDRGGFDGIIGVFLYPPSEAKLTGICGIKRSEVPESSAHHDARDPRSNDPNAVEVG